MFYSKKLSRLLFLFLCPTLIFLVTSCASFNKVLDKDIKQNRAFNEYQQLLKNHMAKDEVFDLNTLSSSVLVKAFYYSPSIQSQALSKWGASPDFSNEEHKWLSNKQKSIIILLGIFSPDFKVDDLLKSGRYTVYLKYKKNTGVSDISKPIKIFSYGVENKFIYDHFPVFDRWEKVFALQFPKKYLTGSNDLTLVIYWPGGVIELDLPEPK